MVAGLWYHSIFAEIDILRGYQVMGLWHHILAGMCDVHDYWVLT